MIRSGTSRASHESSPTRSNGCRAVQVPSPWKAIGDLGLVLERAAIPERGRYYHQERVVVVRRGLLLVEERAVLWHEIAHAVRGDVACMEPILDRRQETAAWRYAARRAVPLRALLAALDASTDPDTVADLLKTTLELLTIRAKSMHPAEKGAVRHHLARREDVA